MSFFTDCGNLATLASLAAVSLLAGERPAQAILNYYIYESGGNVTVETSGSLNVSSPISTTNECSFSGAIVSQASALCTGLNAVLNGYALQSPASFGGTAFILGASAVAGISTGLEGLSSQAFYIEPIYVNNDPIISSATFNNQTLAGLGFTTPGLVGTWKLTSTGDTINVCVGNPGSPCASPAEVPGPLPLFGAAAAFGYSRRLRRRVSLSRVVPNPADSLSV
jgi:hypothetical protein